MSRLIVIFVVLVIWAILSVIKVRQQYAARQDRDGKKPGRNNSAGKKYSWAWMQAAGSMHLKFIRPEEANGYPAINGTVNGITVMVQCSPPSASAPESMVFRFHFPQPAGIGLELKTAEKLDDLPEKNEPDQTGTALLAELLEKRPAGAYFMHVSDPEIFRSCFSTDNLEDLARLSLIYSNVILTDSELLVRTAGINNDPQRFHDQLETLLDIAGSFAGFAKQAAERKEMTILIPKKLAEEEMINRPAPAKLKPEPVRQEPPQPEEVPEPIKQPDIPQPEKVPEPSVQEQEPPKLEKTETIVQDIPEPETTSSDDLPLDQSAFLHSLWQSASSTGRQKELFAPYAGREVEWEGILKMCYTYSTDFVFGKEGGVKATFELEEFKPEGSFMPIKIKVVAAFPKTEFAKLDKASGKKFRFRGKLLKIEPIAREIYLASGSITGA
ncbi:MAG: hypothetical protein IKO93_16095 [Lentisphaeria bacterium]|nr:hypothetical protein [Lentisphaeria bacterium]